MVTPEHLHLIFGQRRAHRRDDRLDARLPQGEHIGVALDHDCPAVLRDRVTSRVQPVQEIALAEQLAFRRVDVLGLERVVVAQAPRLEPDDPAARVGEREQKPRREVVAAAPPGVSARTINL